MSESSNSDNARRFYLRAIGCSALYIFVISFLFFTTSRVVYGNHEVNEMIIYLFVMGFMTSSMLIFNAPWMMLVFCFIGYFVKQHEYNIVLSAIIAIVSSGFIYNSFDMNKSFGGFALAVSGVLPIAIITSSIGALIAIGFQGATDTPDEGRPEGKSGEQGNQKR